MLITPFRTEYLSAAAGLFVGAYRELRRATPALPAAMEDTRQVAARLERLFGGCPGVAAVEDGRLRGYMGWFLVNRFRDTERRGAYCPEWGHIAVGDDKQRIYQAMYRAAATEWASAGCQVHAVTLLAHDHAAERAWFWNGFGLTVVDAVRPVRPLEAPSPTDLRIRRASPEDAGAITALDEEHSRHYSQPPIFMPPQAALDAAANRAFLARPRNSVWLALDGETPAGFIRFKGYDFDGVAIAESERTISINGAYVRPAYRGRRAAAAILDAALRDHAGRGFTCCWVDFESFNPEAASFWPRYFQPVCLSVLRVPENAHL